MKKKKKVLLVQAKNVSMNQADQDLRLRLVRFIF